jgi:hypothetical protein
MRRTNDARASEISEAWPFETDDWQGEIAVTQGRDSRGVEELVHFAGAGGSDHDQLDGRGMLGEIGEEGTFQSNGVDFDPSSVGAAVSRRMAPPNGTYGSVSNAG